ncbi:MAG: hypothetical protein GY811_08545 [Myxococcales bacterium]|nr:hypothetical protein [Myxococcales bacterium]
MAKASARQEPRKPMARTQQVSLFHREIHTTLSSAAIEILLGQAQILSEGQVDDGLYCGSTMITIDCSKAGSWVSDPCDSTTVRQLSDLLLRDDRFRASARDLGMREAQRLARQPLGTTQIEMSLRVAGSNLHVDLDIEATPSQARAS